MEAPEAGPSDALNVWSARRLVGRLWRDRTGRIGFRYDPDWLDDGFDFSRMLPRRREPYSPEDGVGHIFFSNLLPEGGARERVVRDLSIANADFELLRAIGGECAGALSLLPLDEAPSDKGTYVPLPVEAVARMVKTRGHILASYAPERRPRLSLAGAQDKVALLVREGQFFLPEGEAPSSHILKFELTSYRHVPAYETFTTMLAGEIGLPVVEIDFLEIAKQACSLTTRFDRYGDETGEIRRMHQEDFCQALGFPPEKKYQDSGGPSFALCFSALRDISSEPATDARNLLRWQIFNVLAGNSDGHAKNLSLLHLEKASIRLAPFYDLVCTRAIDRIDRRLAFDVGGERDPGRVLSKHWDELASQCDVRKQFVRRLVGETARSILERVRFVRQAFEERFRPYPALQRVEAVVLKQCRRAVAS